MADQNDWLHHSHYSPSRPSLSAPNDGSPPRTVSIAQPTSRAGAQTSFESISRPRPKTPSYTPGPPVSRPSSVASQVVPTSLMQRTVSPTGNAGVPVRSHSRQPSTSLVPAPKLNLSPPSRPGSFMSNRSPSTTTTSSTGVFSRRQAGRGRRYMAVLAPITHPHEIYQSPLAHLFRDCRHHGLDRRASSLQADLHRHLLPTWHFYSVPSCPGSRTSVSGGVFTAMLTDTPVHSYQVERVGHGGRESHQWHAVWIYF